MKLSDKEWRVLDALWAAGDDGLSLGAGGGGLRPSPRRSPSTLLTYLTPMGGKGLVTIDKGASPHRYRPAVRREDWAAAERQGLLDRVYQGSAGKLVAAFVRDGALTAQEREELRRLLDEMEV